MGRRLRVEADGGSRGNPGVAGYGALVRDLETGALLVELAEPLGKASNNVAEYRGMIAGISAAREIDPGADVEVAMDSKLVVEQMSGRWKIKHADMRTLALEARDVVEDISDAGGSVTFTWIPRAENGDADKLSNDGMDGQSVARWHETDESDAGLAGPPGTDGPVEGTKLLLVVAGGEEKPLRRDVNLLVGDEPARLLVWGHGEDAARTAEQLADILDTPPVTEDGPTLRRWQQVLGEGGTAVAVADVDGVRAILGDALGIAPERQAWLLLAPGSRTAVQVADGRLLVPFVNRT